MLNVTFDPRKQIFNGISAFGDQKAWCYNMVKINNDNLQQNLWFYIYF